MQHVNSAYYVQEKRNQELACIQGKQAACSDDWLVRGLLLLTDLVREKNTVPTENLRSFTRSTGQPNRPKDMPTYVTTLAVRTSLSSCIDNIR